MAEGESKGFIEECKQLGFSTACEQQWQRTVAHATAYPYVWASYAVVYGGFSIYGAWRWRQLRKIENEVVQYQRELLKSLEQQETTTAASHLTKDKSRLAPQQRKPEAPQVSSVPMQGVTEKPPLKA